MSSSSSLASAAAAAQPVGFSSSTTVCCRRRHWNSRVGQHAVAFTLSETRSPGSLCRRRRLVWRRRRRQKKRKIQIYKRLREPHAGRLASGSDVGRWALAQAATGQPLFGLSRPPRVAKVISASQPSQRVLSARTKRGAAPLQRASGGGAIGSRRQSLLLLLLLLMQQLGAQAVAAAAAATAFAQQATKCLLGASPPPPPRALGGEFANESSLSGTKRPPALALA